MSAKSLSDVAPPVMGSPFAQLNSMPMKAMPTMARNRAPMPGQRMTSNRMAQDAGRGTFQAPQAPMRPMMGNTPFFPFQF